MQQPPAFILFADRVIATSQIVSLAPPTRNGQIYEIVLRLPSFEYRETFDVFDAADAEARWSYLTRSLLGHEIAVDLSQHNGELPMVLH